MAGKFGKPKGSVPKPLGKGMAQVMFPSRAALNQVTKGDPMQQSLGNYAKLTPSGAGAMAKTYPEIMEEGQKGTSVFP